MCLDRILHLNNGLVVAARLRILLLDLLHQSFSFSVLSPESTSLFLQVTLVLHTLFDDRCQLLLVTILELINLDPGLLFDALPLINIVTLELLDLRLFLLVLVVLGKLLQSMLLSHLSLGFVLLEEQLLDVLLEVQLLLFLRGQKCVLTLLIRVHLLSVLLFFDA